MLLVNARAGLSDIHGIGLIAQEFIPKGARIWTFKEGFDLVIPKQDLQLLSSAARDQVIWYAYYDYDLEAYILSSDDDRFTNHSENPNTANEDDYTYALIDIYPSTEITWDYREWISTAEL
jgi:uncharacterized protein